eukprot:CAMPEP_0170550686 /NCGR_PEP_ID=MMETSP0211-20121228/8700_1 /TAXON_ID=311385 /ORGANISM="Pseudokeronopsis sp., Strain OXSARD2" /LENGTH=173 /DNA_ID=CAMNT_0010857349 /DNA_START=283 /DNA_END=805 /DNA_ORIENTATION=-
MSDGFYDYFDCIDEDAQTDYSHERPADSVLQVGVVDDFREEGQMVAARQHAELIELFIVENGLVLEGFEEEQVDDFEEGEECEDLVLDVGEVLAENDGDGDEEASEHEEEVEEDLDQRLRVHSLVQLPDPSNLLFPYLPQNFSEIPKIISGIRATTTMTIKAKVVEKLSEVLA